MSFLVAIYAKKKKKIEDKNGKGLGERGFSPKTFKCFYCQLPKIYLHFQNINSLIYIYICKISSQCPRTVGVDYSLHRIYEGNHTLRWEESM